MSITGISAVKPEPTAALFKALSGSSARGQSGELSEEQQKEVADLKKRDQEVRQHEQAHLAASGNYAKGGAQFKYKTGPDGNRYAVGGEVSIDASAVPDDPEATIRKAQVVQRAALAPADPSSQDYKVAAEAKQLELESRREVAEQTAEEMKTYTAAGSGNPPKSAPVFVDKRV